MSVLVLLTAAVEPDVAGPVAISDPALRLAQYRTAAAAWSALAARGGLRLALVETTGHAEDLARLTRTPVVAFRPSAAQRARGKGAVEAAAVAHVLEHGAVGRAVRDGDTVYKCTGRLRVANADRVVRGVPPGAVVGRAPLDLAFVDTRLLGATAAVWRSDLAGLPEEVDDRTGAYLERVCAARILRGMSQRRLTFLRFPARPRFRGASGSTGRRYHDAGSAARSLAAEPVEWLLRSLPRSKQF